MTHFYETEVCQNDIFVKNGALSRGARFFPTQNAKRPTRTIGFGVKFMQTDTLFSKKSVSVCHFLEKWALSRGEMILSPKK